MTETGHVFVFCCFFPRPPPAALQQMKRILHAAALIPPPFGIGDGSQRAAILRARAGAGEVSES